MQTSLFSFNLPDYLIAKNPPEVRGNSRLMVLNRYGKPHAVRHETVQALPRLLEPGTLMVFNDTKVRRVRIFAVNADTGGRGEFLFLRPLGPNGEWDCLVDKVERKRIGQQWLFPGKMRGRITGILGVDRRSVFCDPPPSENWFDRYGHIPLPLYMHRPAGPEDSKRYQTVYAKEPGSIAAPTAGLHFTTEILDTLRSHGIQTAWITLQVGYGTFAPVRSETVSGHTMHSEEYDIPKETAQAVEKAKAEGNCILAVGTTTVRTLEAAWKGTTLKHGPGSTNLFIYPGYQFNAVDAVFTNFHTPKSSLLMLISAFTGRKHLLEAYATAIDEEYRFFSYGDAMLIV